MFQTLNLVGRTHVSLSLTIVLVSDDFKSCFIDLQTQEREAKAEMRRKAKELQQARRDAERSGKKVPAFGGFGSSGMTSISSGSIITDTIVEPEKPKITPAPVRCSIKSFSISFFLLFRYVMHRKYVERCLEALLLQTKWTQQGPKTGGQREGGGQLCG